MTAQMISTGTEQNPLKTHSLQSQDVNIVYDFLKRNTTTAGFSIQYGIAGNQVFELFKKGKLGKKDIKLAIERYHINEWHFSWAWASKKWIIGSEVVTAVQIDLTPSETTKTAWQYRNVLG